MALEGPEAGTLTNSRLIDDRMGWFCLGIGVVKDGEVGPPPTGFPGWAAWFRLLSGLGIEPTAGGGDFSVLITVRG